MNEFELWRHRESWRPVDTAVERSLGRADNADASSPIVGTRITLHDDVPVTQLARALTRFGLTLSNVAGVGLVIHKADDQS